MKSFFYSIFLVAAIVVSGCVSIDREAQLALTGLNTGNDILAESWSSKLADKSTYSRNLGAVESGRTMLLTGKYADALQRFNSAVDSAVDRTEASPRLKVADMLNTAISATVTDDRTREYYLPPYEVNFALEYSILSRLLRGDRDGALVDARLSVYVQDTLAQTYGVDIQKEQEGATDAAKNIIAEQGEALESLMASSRNSWENPLLWWLSGVLFEADGDTDMAWQSYRKAAAVNPGCNTFAADASRAEKIVQPASGKSRLVIIYEKDFVPQRESLKVPVPVYTGMSIDIPKYGAVTAVPSGIFVSCSQSNYLSGVAVDVRSLAARDLKENLPGVVVRNITRAAVQASAQAAVNASGNTYAKVGVFAVNAIVSAIRKADTRSWVTLPAVQYVWSNGEMDPGEHNIDLNVDGKTVSAKVALCPGETRILWIAQTGAIIRGASVKASANGNFATDLNGKEISL